MRPISGRRRQGRRWERVIEQDWGSDIIHWGNLAPVLYGKCFPEGYAFTTPGHRCRTRPRSHKER